MKRAREALAMPASGSSRTAQKRKSGSGNREMEFNSMTLYHLRSCRRAVVTPENSASPATSGDFEPLRTSKDSCSSSSFDHVLESSCSSNGSSEMQKESLKCTDLLEESVEIASSECSSVCRDRRERTPLSNLQSESAKLESMARPSEANSHRRSTVENAPPESGEPESTPRPWEANSHRESTVEKPSDSADLVCTARPSEPNSHMKDMQVADELEELFSAANKEESLILFTKKYNYDFVNEVPLEGRYEWVPLTP